MNETTAGTRPSSARPRRRRLGKRLLESRAAGIVLGTCLRGYRWFAFGGFRLRTDPALRRLLKGREPAVFLCWHQDFLHTMGWLSRWSPRRPTYVLASPSRDGGLAAAAAEAVGFREAVRGSSAERGASALLRLEREARAGRASVAFVGDGPRPPAFALKPGALHLASRAGLPVWLVRTSWAPDASLARTWARFHAPRPWARGVVLCDGPIEVPRDASREVLERTRAEVEGRLQALARRADEAALALQRPPHPAKSSLRSQRL